MKVITTNKGQEIKVSNIDYPLLRNHTWSVTNNGYACTFIKIGIRYKQVLMHRMIKGTPKGMDTDHINGDKLDNRRSNLRVCTRSQNRMNQRISRSRKTKYKGIYKRGDKWIAQISKGSLSKNLGIFLTEKEAAKAYDKAAKQHFGKYACLNFNY